MSTIRMPVVTLDAGGRTAIIGSCDMPNPDQVPCYVRVAEPMAAALFRQGQAIAPINTRNIRSGTFKIIMATIPPMRGQIAAVLASRDSAALTWLPGWTPA